MRNVLDDAASQKLLDCSQRHVTSEKRSAKKARCNLEYGKVQCQRKSTRLEQRGRGARGKGVPTGGQLAEDGGQLKDVEMTDEPCTTRWQHQAAAMLGEARLSGLLERLCCRDRVQRALIQGLSEKWVHPQWLLIRIGVAQCGPCSWSCAVDLHMRV